MLQLLGYIHPIRRLRQVPETNELQCAVKEVGRGDETHVQVSQALIPTTPHCLLRNKRYGRRAETARQAHAMNRFPVMVIMAMVVWR